MNILIAANYAAPYGGNFIASLIELGERIESRGDSVCFVFPLCVEGERDWAQWMKMSGFELHYLNNELSDDEKITFLKELVNQKKVDVLHLHFGMFLRTVRQNRRLFKNTKVLVHDHMDYSVHPSVLKQKMMCYARSFDYMLKRMAVVTVMEKKLRGYIFCSQKWYVPNGLSFRRNVAHSETRDEVRSKIQIESDRVLCLLLGWDMERKGIDIAVNAVHQLRTEGVDAVLGLVGLGSELSTQQRTFIEQRCKLDADSTWIKYIESREDMFALHRAADIYLSASRKEAFSYGILEAISQNIPVVVSDIEGTKWSWDYSKCYSYPVEDPKKCAEAIKLALKCENKSNAEIFVERYNIQKWCDQIIEIYNKL